MPSQRRFRIRPLVAVRALRALVADPDDTAQSFVLIAALAGRREERNMERFRSHPTGARVLAERRDLLEVLRDRAALAALPAGTLGREYLEFMRGEDLHPDGFVAASDSMRFYYDLLDADELLFEERLREMHDLSHVVAGYGRDLLGEAALVAFTLAQVRTRGMALLTAGAYKESGRFPGGRKLMREAYGRGRRAAWFPVQDWEHLLTRPLDEVRALLGVHAPPVYTPRWQ